MVEYRRAFEPGGIFFFTLVTHQRRGFLCEPTARQCLRRAFEIVQSKYPFEIVGIALLPEHLHCLWQLPENDGDFSTRWRYIKGEFTRRWLVKDGQEGTVGTSRQRHRERGVWQRRFWEHVIRDEKDMIRHLDYIHYNPVKHGLVQCPHQWEYSSLDKWVRKKCYDADWQCCCAGRSPVPPVFGDIQQSCGE